MSEMDFVMHALPNFWKEVAGNMNKHSRLDGRSEVKVAEVKQFFGCILAMTCQLPATCNEGRVLARDSR
jgi:hypothetical protein